MIREALTMVESSFLSVVKNNNDCNDWEVIFMRKGVNTILALSLVLLCLALLVPVPPVRAQLLPEFQDIIALNRLRLDDEWDAEEYRNKFAQLLYQFDSFQDEPVVVPVSDGPRGIVTKEQAIEDVEYFFSLMKYGYAGYQYFGGDESFLDAKEKVQKEIGEINSSQLSVAALEDILYRHLSFINDGHFNIWSKRLYKPVLIYMDFDYAFSQDEKGYYLETDRTREYLQSVNGENPEPFMRSSLNSEGQLVYRMACLEDGGKHGLDTDFILRSTQGERTVTTTLLEVVSSRLPASPVYQYITKDEIPIVSIRSFPYMAPRGEKFDVEAYQQMESFLLDAHMLRDEPVLIIDLRSHGGGDGSKGASWVRNFTGSPFGGQPQFLATLQTNTSHQLNSNYLMESGRDLPSQTYLMRPKESGWSQIYYLLPERISNETLVVVLTDSWIASAAELFLESLKQMDNVLIIGSNTAGASLTNRTTSALPNSLLPISFGVSLRLSLDLVDREGVGILPDLWVHPDEALDLAVKFINNYVRDEK